MKQPKPTFATRVTRAAIHTNSKLGSDCLCYFAEAIAPGFSGCIQNRIACRVNEKWDEDLQYKWEAFRCFKPKRYWLFLHLFIVWMGVKIVESHDPFELSFGDLVKTKGDKHNHE